jgi:hypothetical protein
MKEFITTIVVADNAYKYPMNRGGGEGRELKGPLF